MTMLVAPVSARRRPARQLLHDGVGHAAVRGTGLPGALHRFDPKARTVGPHRVCRRLRRRPAAHRLPLVARGGALPGRGPIQPVAAVRSRGGSRRLAERAAQHCRRPPNMRVAIFTDNDFSKVNGVTTTLTVRCCDAPADHPGCRYTYEQPPWATSSHYLALRAFGVGIPFYRK